VNVLGLHTILSCLIKRIDIIIEDQLSRFTAEAGRLQ
jgi:hypothetical protein